MLSIVLPILLLSILNLLVFIVPGDKSSYSVTVFLAFSIFLTIVEATMPNNSTSVAVFSIYVILMTAQSTIITIIAVLVERGLTFDEDEADIPKWLITLSNIGKFSTCRNRKWATKVNAVSKEEQGEAKKTGLDNEPEPEEIEEKYTWKQVMNGIDAFCFVFFSIFTVIVTLICMVVSAAGSATK